MIQIVPGWNAVKVEGAWPQVSETDATLNCALQEALCAKCIVRFCELPPYLVVQHRRERHLIEVLPAGGAALLLIAEHHFACSRRSSGSAYAHLRLRTSAVARWSRARNHARLCAAGRANESSRAPVYSAGAAFLVPLIGLAATWWAFAPEQKRRS